MVALLSPFLHKLHPSNEGLTTEDWYRWGRTQTLATLLVHTMADGEALHTRALKVVMTEEHSQTVLDGLIERSIKRMGQLNYRGI